ncbi:hypothetical protein N7478_002488 [Penicillium angulare]|uniref:uncharacterized protein n=1 Tax=Penicillium angulare TaxID=116970 RepID=UPI00253F8010|nr:uncharacterized protein N7478_002488 [Penicillium angulare]KAJ5286802.1 hypothetical protein N7478_002488 [Penicillium angulare]
MNELTEGLRSTHLSDGSDALDRPEETDHLEQLPFYPPRSLGTTQKRLPRFLFRIATPESDGSTNKIWVKSQAAKDNRPSSTEDIFSNFTIKKRTNIAEILKVHLRWWPKYDLDDNFVSWTSSLLFAIQYIYYRHLSKKNRSSLANIKLYVIDTTKFPKGTFMRDLDLINIFCEYDQSEEYKSLRRVKTWRDGDLYFGEYLSQGALKIENKCQVIPADLIFQNNRLRRIQPNFAEPGEKEGDWAKEVIRLRKDIWSSSDLPVLSSADMIDRLKAIEEILENVEPIWRYPIAIYLAGLTGPMLWGKLDQETPDDSAFFSFFQSGLLQDDREFLRT